jgi:hypothetical protein
VQPNPMARLGPVKAMLTRQSISSNKLGTAISQMILRFSVGVLCVYSFIPRVSERDHADSILNPSAALQSTAEDYLDSLSSSPSLALADLINCILRACGCNESVDSDQVMDSDGVVDVLDTFTDGLKQVRF